MNILVKYAVLCILLIYQINAQSHNIEWGTKHVNDRQLYREIVVKEYSVLRIVEQNVTFTAPNKITYIKATDQYVNGNGGYATLMEGGPDYNNVTINLRSQRNHGFNFIIEIFGTLN